MAEEVRGTIELNMRVIGDVPTGEAPTPPGAGGVPAAARAVVGAPTPLGADRVPAAVRAVGAPTPLGAGEALTPPLLTSEQKAQLDVARENLRASKEMKDYQKLVLGMDKEKHQQTLGSMGDMKKFLGTIGQGATIVALASHSKIVSTTIGSVFTMLAAIFDLALMPFMPVISKALQGLAQSVQGWSYIMQGVGEFFKDPLGTMMQLGKVIGDIIVIVLKEVWFDIRMVLSKVPGLGELAPVATVAAGAPRREEMPKPPEPLGAIAALLHPRAEAQYRERMEMWVNEMKEWRQRNTAPIVNVYVEGRKVENVRLELRDQYLENLHKANWERHGNVE